MSHVTAPKEPQIFLLQLGVPHAALVELREQRIKHSPVSGTPRAKGAIYRHEAAPRTMQDDRDSPRR